MHYYKTERIIRGNWEILELRNCIRNNLGHEGWFWMILIKGSHGDFECITQINVIIVFCSLEQFLVLLYMIHIRIFPLNKSSWLTQWILPQVETTPTP